MNVCVINKNNNDEMVLGLDKDCRRYDQSGLKELGNIPRVYISCIAFPICSLICGLVTLFPPLRVIELIELYMNSAPISYYRNRNFCLIPHRCI